MYCYQCGTEIEEHFKFCSKCGRSLDQGQTRGSRRDMSTHINILAWLFIGTAVLYGLIGTTLMIVPGVLQHIPITIGPFGHGMQTVDPWRFALTIMRIVGFAIIVASAGTAAAGVGLMQYQSWGRTLAIIMSVILLLKFPIGTAAGIYGLWVLLSAEGREHYQARSA